MLTTVCLLAAGLVRDPVGVVASIAPWNYPLQMGAWKILPAIAAGNTIVLKPSELTPITSVMLAQAAGNHDFPAAPSGRARFDLVISTGTAPESRSTPASPLKRGLNCCSV